MSTFFSISLAFKLDIIPLQKQNDNMLQHMYGTCYNTCTAKDNKHINSHK